MRQRILLACGVFCVCLVIWLMYYGEQRLPGTRPNGKGPQKVFDIDANEIYEILIRGSTNLGMEKKSGIWRIVEPKPLMADQKEVCSLVSGFVGLGAERLFEARGPLHEFGLDEPALIVSVRTARGWYSLALGNESPTSQFCYAVVPGKKDVMLLPVQVKHALGRDLFSLRERRLVHIEPGSILGLRLASSRMFLDIEKDRTGDWRFSGDEEKRLRTDLINGFIDLLARTEAVGFPEERVVPGEPCTVVELDAADRTCRIEIWKQGERVFCISDLQKENVEIDGSLLRAMLHDPDDIVDKRIVDLRQKVVRKIEISGDPGRRFIRQQDGWYADGRKITRPGHLTSLISLLGSIDWEDEYLMLPGDATKEGGIRISHGPSSPGFDIELYSQYYVRVGEKVYRINEGDMKSLGASIKTLLKEKR